MDRISRNRLLVISQACRLSRAALKASGRGRSSVEKQGPAGSAKVWKAEAEVGWALSRVCVCIYIYKYMCIQINICMHVCIYAQKVMRQSSRAGLPRAVNKKSICGHSCWKSSRICIWILSRKPPRIQTQAKETSWFTGMLKGAGS